MSKQSKQQPTISSFLDSHWSNHPAVEWALNNKQTLLWAALGIFAGLILTYRVLMNRSINAEGDFFRAQTAFVNFQEAAIKSKSEAAATLKELESIMKTHPELHGKYDAPLAQTLLIEDQIPLAEKYAQATFKRTKNDFIDNYHEFAATSLLIGNGNYQEALVQAQNLKEKMNAESSKTENTLYFFNLIRLAVLHQQIGNNQEEKQLWEEVKTLSAQTDLSGLLNLFTEGQADFSSYLQKRQN